MNDFDFKDKNAVITGAASGIGRELCIQLAKEGCNISAADVNEKGLRETEDAVRAAGKNIICYITDVSDRKQVFEFAEKTIYYNNSIDIVINNAGVAMSDVPAENIDFKDFEWMMNINLWGVVNTAKAFIGSLKKSRDSYLVNTSSIYGIFAMKNAAAYTTSKFAVRGFSEALVQELHGTSVNVMTVYPGGIKTNIAKNSRWIGETGDTDGQKRQLARFENSAKTEPEDAAKQILQAMKRRKKRLLIGKDARFMDLYVRINPSGYDRFVREHILKEKQR
ncbi:MAG: SDR family oxidoreductase [Endomicrobiaceae bacterium]|nr:SDR family oxidoreductase [Endomicrobiaceae bacterium]